MSWTRHRRGVSLRRLGDTDVDLVRSGVHSEDGKGTRGTYVEVRLETDRRRGTCGGTRSPGKTLSKTGECAAVLVGAVGPTLVVVKRPDRTSRVWFPHESRRTDLCDDSGALRPNRRPLTSCLLNIKRAFFGSVLTRPSHATPPSPSCRVPVRPRRDLRYPHPGDR